MVKIRLARRGRKKLSVYDVVVADARAPRDGRFIEKLGTYNPLTVPAKIDIDDDRAFQWLMQGAQPTDTARAILSYRGILMRKHLQVGVIKGAITQEEADRKFEEWMKGKEQKIEAANQQRSQSREASAKARREAESKVREARAEALRKRAEEAAAAAQQPEAGEQAPETAAEATETPESETGEAKAE